VLASQSLLPRLRNVIAHHQILGSPTARVIDTGQTLQQAHITLGVLRRLFKTSLTYKNILHLGLDPRRIAFQSKHGDSRAVHTARNRRRNIRQVETPRCVREQRKASGYIVRPG
jgi:hypothetical protein